MSSHQGTRQAGNTHSVVNVRQLNKITDKNIVKSADVERFNAAISAKEEEHSQQNLENTSLRNSDGCNQASMPGSETLLQPNFASLSQACSPTNLESSQSINDAHNEITRSTTNLTLALQKANTTPVTQAVEIVQRIIDSADKTKEAKSWKLELLLEHNEMITLSLEYSGHSNWSIGLLDENQGDNSHPDESTYDENIFIEQLQEALAKKNPELRLTLSNARVFV